MKGKSRYFADLYETYSAEISDQLTDSEGKVVIQRRLNEIRQEFGFLLPMMESNPEMVTVPFYGAFEFDARDLINLSVRGDPDEPDFPCWAELAPSLTVAPWADELVNAALTEESGDRFLVIAASLEYLRFLDKGEALPVDAEAEAGARERREHEDGDGEAEDLAEAGNDWLAEQGFDSRN